jgi:hypothetical protein
MYAVNNRGRLYDFGFLIGASAALGGSSSQAVSEGAGRSNER